MLNEIRRLWPIVSIVAIVCAGCDSPPPTDENDPLPKIFDNKPLDPSMIDASQGPGGSRPMRRPGVPEAGVMDGHQHDHGGVLADVPQAKPSKPSTNPSDASPATEPNKTGKDQP